MVTPEVLDDNTYIHTSASRARSEESPLAGTSSTSISGVDIYYLCWWRGGRIITQNLFDNRHASEVCVCTILGGGAHLKPTSLHLRYIVTELNMRQT